MSGPATTRLRADARGRTALSTVAAAVVAGSAVVLFAFEQRPAGYAALALGLVLAAVADAVRPDPDDRWGLLRDLSLVAVGLVAVSSISLEADLTNAGMARFTVALSAAVLLPWVLDRFAFRTRTIVFPTGAGRWTRGMWLYIGIVVLAGYLLLPFYFTQSGAYLNWPALDSDGDIARLFVGVNAVGLWDELFFVCVVLALLRRHLPFATANVLMSAIFVSFLWELGYREWAPVFTIPFALVQGWLFKRTSSLPYVVAVHLLFDAVVFATLVHARHPELFDVFLTAVR